MIRFSVIAFLGLVLLWAGLRRLQQISGSPRLLDLRSIVLAFRIGDAEAWFTLFVTLIGALIVGVSLFVFAGTLVILIIDPF